MDPNSADLSQLTISCVDVPISLLNKSAAKHYFSQFGKVIKIRLRLKQKMCIVEFAHAEDVQRALTEGGTFDCETFQMNLTTPKCVEKKRVHKPKEVVSDVVWNPDSETKAELDSMKGDFTSMYNLRPESVSLDDVVKKSAAVLKKAAKPRQWKSDKITKSKSKNMAQNSEQELELLQFIRKPNATSEEKYRALDARDKLIRLRTVRESNLAKAGKTIGTCSDMCPEKERLMREAQHQIAVYEQVSGNRGTMNHSIAVKQYSRSSADQETPLAHELRPVHVLQMTMGYLLHRIMDLCESPDVNLAEWYHFVWDRTRGIRKDITQQELCSQGSVELVEQCARFHIHCSARLVAEDVSVFDEKINTENLTKCLQTLKYMYDDLALHGETCPNEPEFRAYIVLLNLHDGNFMWEVQQLTECIQKSAHVKFAIQVYFAVDKNNYVQFFKLVKRTHYLNACILLRYFNQVRYKALRTIIKSYSPRQPYTHFPIYELGSLLAFEDIDNTIAFLEYHELTFNAERTHVLLNRRMFHQPDVPFALERAVNIIETKRNETSVGQIVCGGAPLPNKHFENHTPYNSFDDNGYLKLTEIPKGFNFQPENTCFPEPEHEPESGPVTDSNLKPSFTFSNPAGFEPKTNLPQVSTTFTFTHPTTLLSTSATTIPIRTTMSTNVVQYQNQQMDTTDSEYTETKPHTKSFWSNFTGVQPLSKSDIVFSAKESIFGPKSTTDIDEPPLETDKPNTFQLITAENSNSSVTFSFTKQAEKEIQKNIDQEAILQFAFPPSTSKMISSPIITKVPVQSKVPENKIDIEKEKRMREKLIKKKQKEEAAKRFAENKRLDELRKLKQTKKAEVVAERRNDVLFIMNDLLKKVEEQEIDRRLKIIAENIGRRNIQLYVNKWKTLSQLSKKKRKHFFDNPIWISSRSLPEEAEQLYSPSQKTTLHDMKRYKSGSPIQIDPKHNVTIEVLDIFKLAWRLLFEKVNKTNDFLNIDIFWKIAVSLPAADLTKGTHRFEEIISSAFDWTDEKIVKSIRANNGGYFTYCISNATALQNDANGLILFHLNGISIVQTSTRLLDVLANNQTAIPLVIIINGAGSSLELIQYLKLQQLVDKQIITDYRIIIFNENINESLSAAVSWLAESSDLSTELQMDSLTTCLRNSIGEELWHRIRSSADMNLRLNVLLRQPNVAIELHNNAICLLSKKILFHVRHLHFPNEFKQFLNSKQVNLPCTFEYFPNYWKTKSYQTKINNIIESMRLPLYEDDWPPKTKQLLQTDLLKYLSKIFTEPTQMLLKLLSVIFKDNSNQFPMSIKNIFWGDVVELLVVEKIKNTQYLKHSDNILIVVYNCIELKEMQKMAWWYSTQIIHENIRNVQIDEDSIVIEEDSDEDIIDIDRALTDLQNANVLDRTNAKEDIKCMTLLLGDLEKSIDIQKKIMLKFQETAKCALE